MNDTRRKDVSWTIKRNPDGSVSEMDAHLAVMMDLRDELKNIHTELRMLNSIIGCSNFIAVPSILRQVAKHTKPKPKPRKPRAA